MTRIPLNRVLLASEDARLAIGNVVSDLYRVKIKVGKDGFPPDTDSKGNFQRGEKRIGMYSIYDSQEISIDGETMSYAMRYAKDGRHAFMCDLAKKAVEILEEQESSSVVIIDPESIACILMPDYRISRRADDIGDWIPYGGTARVYIAREVL